MLRADERPFLEAALARPQDDGPRLVYADFLEQCDDPADAARGELVRVQLALARTPDDPALNELQAELHERHKAAWLAPLRGFVSDVEFRRGVPDTVTLEAAEFLDRGDELFHLLPVRRVRFQNAGPLMPRLALCPFLVHVRELDLCWNDLGNGGVNLLVRSPHLKRVETLDLGFNGLDDAGVRVFAESSALPSLRELALNDNGPITGEGARAVAESPFVAGLRSLDLSGNDVSDFGVRAIVGSRSLAGLRALKLVGNHIGDAGVVALVMSPLLKQCLKYDSRLDLRKNTIGPGGAMALAGCEGLAAATDLDLTGNYIGDRGFAALAASRHLGKLRVLRLGQNQITNHGVLNARPALARWCKQLRVLDLSGNALTAAGIAAVREAKGESPVAIDVDKNIHPLPIGEVLKEAGLGSLRRRVNHPAGPPG